MPSEMPPTAVLAAYFDNPPRAIHRMKGGVINQTYKITSALGSRYVLQRLHSIFNKFTVQDQLVITEHLGRRGWPAQRVVPTLDGAMTVDGHRGTVWRLLCFVPGSDAPDNMNTGQLRDVASLLARLHTDLRLLDYRPQFTLPHFHDITYYANKLRAVQDSLPTAELRHLAQRCLLTYVGYVLPDGPRQLIHGDPRTTNILFARGKPICYIDFDTLMVATPWIDIGDLLRSVNGSKDQTMPQFSLERSQIIAAGYYAANPLRSSFDAFFWDALKSMSLICIELTMRFLTDVVDDCYFGWDSTHFSSRRDNNIARAMAQWAIYEEAKGYSHIKDIPPAALL